MAATRTRKDVWKLGEWDPILLWYAKAVGEMLRRPLNDPTSWRYQAAIHGYERQRDPYRSDDDLLPSEPEKRRFWLQCQHHSWFFLSWHRMYLGFFERIVASTVRQLGGPDDWALPYWNYSDAANPNVRQLPPAFRAARLPDGSNNALRVEQRIDGANTGETIASSLAVSLRDCLRKERYTAQGGGGDPGFGGPRTGFNHSTPGADRVVGELERSPHGTIHGAVGGARGWMSAFDTAGLDPIFWLHHCNIDRLWDVWLRRDARHSNPMEAAWLTELAFEFHDATREVVQLTSSQVIDTTAAPFSYEYEDLSDPLGVPPSPMEVVRRPRMGERRIPEMVGATQESLTLGAEPTMASLAVSRPTGPGTAFESTAAPRRIFLNIENITSSGIPGSYLVFINLPEGADPEAHEELYAGILPMFGVAEATEATQNHPGDGLHYSLDITDIVKTLEARNDWDPDNLRVSFVPERRGSAFEKASASPVQVGRVSIYFA
jgi:tyrosinase